MDQQLTPRMRIIDAQLLKDEGIGLPDFIVQQVNAGISLKDLAKELGLSRATLDNWMFRLGIRKERRLTMTKV